MNGELRAQTGNRTWTIVESSALPPGRSTTIWRASHRSIGQDHGGRGHDRSATRPAAAAVVRRHVDVKGLDNEKTYLQASNGLNSVQEGNRQ